VEPQRPSAASTRALTRATVAARSSTQTLAAWVRRASSRSCQPAVRTSVLAPPLPLLSLPLPRRLLRLLLPRPRLHLRRPLRQSKLIHPESPNPPETAFGPPIPPPARPQTINLVLCFLEMSKPTKVAAAVAFSCTDNVVDRDTLVPLLVPPASVSRATSGTRSASRCSVYPTCAHASIGFGVVKKNVWKYGWVCD
jgi:hypothetical protein